MGEFVRLCSVKDMPPPGAAAEMQAGGRAICVANIDGRLAALDNLCPHRQGPLGEGSVEDGTVVCPWHSWAFDARTGEAVHNPGVSVSVFPLRIDGEDVLIELDR